jgi:O-antigen/teichoic acid export membrane protein
LASNSIRYVTSISIRIIGPILSAIAGLVLAREMGPELYGKVAVILSLVFVGGVFSEFGLPGLITLYFTQEETNSNSIIKVAKKVLIFATLTSISLCSIFLILDDTGSVLFIELAAIVLCLLPCVYSYEKFWIESTAYRFLSSNLEAVALVLFSILKLAVAMKLTNNQYLAVLILHIVQIFFIVACRKYIFHKNYKYVNKDKVVTTKSLIEGAKYLSFSSISIALYSKLDILMISSMKGDEVAGNYAIMVALFGFLTMPPNMLSQLFFPELIMEKGSSKWLSIIKLFTLYSVIAFIAMWLFLDELYDFMFEGIYSFNGYVTLFLGGAILFHSWAMVSSKFITIKGFYRYAAIRTFVALLLNVSLNFILIPTFNEAGAAFATLISYLWLGLGSDFAIKGTRNIAYLKVLSFNPLWKTKVNEL